MPAMTPPADAAAAPVPPADAGAILLPLARGAIAARLRPLRAIGGSMLNIANRGK